MTVGGAAANSYVITIPSVPGSACGPLTNLLQQNSKLAVGACPAVGSSASVTVTVTE
jgi:hypothetical protein